VTSIRPDPDTLEALAAEIVLARAKFPGNRHLLAALTEEVGELAKALLQGRPEDEWEREALQVACVAIRILEEGDAEFAALTDEEKQP
jgi:NTP pyrophosphatase (non-canonical NTP hydrolase)